MFRVVLDSNIYISAVCFSMKAPPGQIYIGAIQGRFELWVSPAILLETTDKLKSKFNWEQPRLKQFVRQIGRIAKIAQPENELEVITSDPSDNRILECAVAAKAQFIVTGDKHLLTLEQYNDTLVITPSAFVGLMK